MQFKFFYSHHEHQIIILYREKYGKFYGFDVFLFWSTAERPLGRRVNELDNLIWYDRGGCSQNRVLSIDEMVDMVMQMWDGHVKH